MLIQVISRIQFIVIVGLRIPFSFLLSIEGHPRLLEDSHIPWLKGPIPLPLNPAMASRVPFTWHLSVILLLTSDPSFFVLSLSLTTAKKDSLLSMTLLTSLGTPRPCRKISPYRKVLNVHYICKVSFAYSQVPWIKMQTCLGAIILLTTLSLGGQN